MFSDTFAGIAPSSVAGFILAQVVGGSLGYLLVRALYPAVCAPIAEEVLRD
jgi:arsenate reductase